MIRNHDRWWYAFVAAVAAGLLIFVVLYSTSGRHGTKAVTATKSPTTATNAKSSGARTTTSQKAPSGTTTTQQPTTTTTKETTAPFIANSSIKKLKAESAAFLTDLYNISPNTTDESHRVFIRRMSGPATFEISNSLLEHLSLGLDQTSTTSFNGPVNQLRAQKQLSITGQANINREQITAIGESGSVKVVQVQVAIRAITLSHKAYNPLSQKLMTSSAWRLKGKQWVLIAFHAPPLQLNTS